MKELAGRGAKRAEDPLSGGRDGEMVRWRRLVEVERNTPMVELKVGPQHTARAKSN